MQYLRWNTEGAAYSRNFEIGEVTRKIVQESFKRFDKEGKFTDDLLDLYDLFVYD